MEKQKFEPNDDLMENVTGGTYLNLQAREFVTNILIDEAKEAVLDMTKDFADKMKL